MINMFTSLFDDDYLADEVKEEQELKKIKPKKEINEYGDKMGKREICQGIVLLASIGGLIACACMRGCEEIKKHHSKALEKAKVVQSQNMR